MNRKDFFICGLTGWCMEIVFTALGSLLRGNLMLTGQTSVWMFPIYGLAAFIRPISKKICHLPLLFRASLYASAIMSVDFLSGSFLRLFSICTWNYNGCPNNISGLVRLDYFPVWMAAGLIFEWILNDRKWVSTKIK